jgi:hypothetical protein
MTLPLALAFAEAGFAVVPVNVFRRGNRWRKVPYVSWRGETNQATTDTAKIKEWWDKWSSAMPGLPLRRHVVIDADRHPGKPDGRAAPRTRTVSAASGQPVEVRR